MFYVYILRSVKDPRKTYVGFTNNIANRLDTHNTGGSIYTAKYCPWKLLGYTTFFDETRAIAFEQYLKSGSGKSFSARHFF